MEFDDEAWLAFNARIWWSTKVKEYPILSQIAHRWIMLPITSAEIERNFCTSTDIMSILRSCLGNHTMFMYLHNNQKDCQ